MSAIATADTNQLISGMAAIPESHQHLVDGPLVWVDTDGEYVLINTTLERQKDCNMRMNPVTLLVIDPQNSSRWIEVRGCVRAMTTVGAEAHADRLTQRYSPPRQHLYGDVYPSEQKYKETRVIVQIEPLKISRGAIFKDV